MARAPRYASTPSPFSPGGATAMLKKRPIPKLRRTLSLERLEDRTLLAGNLTVSVNAGTLTITGDQGNVSQDFEIFPLGAGAVLVESATSTINGAAQPFVANNVNNIIATLFDGMDSATINQISITGFINITLGTGNDQLMVDNSIFGQLDATAGREQDGAGGNITAE